MNALENIKIVLVETSHGSNIGSVARAMKVMGLRHLILVNPSRFPSADALALASGADDLLQHAAVVETLEEAIADCQVVVGTSARRREFEWPMQTPREFAQMYVRPTSNQKTAIVFGREKYGLTNQELSLCQKHIAIPTSQEYASLNLSQAVQILAYECRQAALSECEAAVEQDSTEYPTSATLNSFFTRLEQTLISLDYLDPTQPKKLMLRLRRLFARAVPDSAEINILQGILTAIVRQK